MRQPGDGKKSIVGVMAGLCLVVLVGGIVVFAMVPTFSMSRLAQREEEKFFAAKGFSPQAKVKFIKEVKYNLTVVDGWFKLKEIEENFRRAKKEEKNPRKTGKIGEELERIPPSFLFRLIGEEQMMSFLGRAGWILSLVCFRLAVLKFSWILWVIFFPLAFLLAQIKRKRASMGKGNFSSYAFHIGRGAVIVFLVVLPLAYLLSPVRLPATFFLGAWVLFPCLAFYHTMGNLPGKL